MVEKVETLLNQIRIISSNLKKQRAEKLAKGENFNIFNDLDLMSDEVHLHSSMLATLLNPKASHGQNDKFLYAFMEMLHNVYSDIKSDFIETSKVSVQVEKPIGKLTDKTGGRIDLYLTDTQHSIIIENKIYADDQNNQLLRYWNFEKDNKHDDKSFIIIYLTLDGSTPSEKSLSGLDPSKIICVSYKNDIRNWLERCVEISACLPLIRETINQYINTIDILTNNIMSTNEDMLQILSNEKNLDAVFDIINSRESLVDYIMNNIFLPKLKDLAEMKGFKLIVNSKKWVSKSWAGARFEHKEWKNFDLAFEFEGREMRSLIFGFIRKKDIKYEDILNWKDIQDAYPPKYENNTLWIYKDFSGNKNWLSAQGMRDLISNKTLNDFSEMIDEAVKSVESLPL